MSRFDLYVIEARDAAGQLDFTVPDPQFYFGSGAAHGLSTDAMAQAIFRKVPDAMLDGRDICNWPKLINPKWIARRKTW